MSQIESRKQQHVELAMSAGAESRASALWEDVELLPVSVPDMVISDIDLTTEFLGHTLSTPLLITGMTGGYDHALEINRNLAAVADELGVAIGTGSQRGGPGESSSGIDLFGCARTGSRGLCDGQYRHEPARYAGRR